MRRTFFELVDRLRREAGASGPAITTLNGVLPTETQRLRDDVVSAWEDIQTERDDWLFLFTEATCDVPQFASIVSPPEFAEGTVADWDEHSFRIAVAGETRAKSDPLTFRDYFVFRDHHGLDPTKRGKPGYVSVHPNRESIYLAPSADVAYTLFYDYMRTPQVFDDDQDEPLMPARFHDLIVWRALEAYALRESATESLSKARRMAGPLQAALERDQLPQMTQRSLCD